MEKHQRDRVNKALPKLIENTECNTNLLGILISAEVFSVDDMQHIKSCTTPNEKSMCFYQLIQTKHNGFAHLINALSQTRQTGAYNILKNNKSQLLSGIFIKPPEGLRDFLDSDGNQVLIISTANSCVTLQKIEDTPIKEDIYMVYDKKILPLLNNDNSSILPILLEIDTPAILRKLINLNRKIVCVFEGEIREILSLVRDMKFPSGLKQIVDEFKWGDLSNGGKVKLFERKVLTLLTGNFEISLKTIHGQWLSSHGDSFFRQFLNEKLLIECLRDHKPVLFNLSIPSWSEYLERVLVSRSRVSKAIFQWETEKDKFVISGLEKNALSTLVRKAIKNSRECVSKHANLDGAKFIILDSQTDFEKLKCKGTDNFHWLDHVDGRFEWVTSTGNLRIIQKFRLTQSDQKFIEETCFLKTLIPRFQQIRKNLPVCISGFPGIGKSLLFRHFGREISSKQQQLVIFLKISEFVNQLQNQKQNNHSSKKENILECLTKCSRPNYDFSRQLLRYLMESTTLKIELMLDGYDEESQVGREVLKEYLRELVKFPSIRIWITTRPQYLDELERLLNVTGYNILELDEQLQKKLLVDYWSRNQDLDTSKLEYFASIYLSALPSQVRIKSENLVGIPLQCSILAEVMEKEAVNYVTFGNMLTASSEVPRVAIKPITDLIEKMLEKKWEIFVNFAKTKKIRKEDMLNLHIYYAINLLFPHLKESNSMLQIYVENNVIAKEDILKFGLLQMDMQTNSLVFITHSVAEYLAALFCANILKGQTETNPDHEFVISDIVFNLTTDPDNNLSNFKNEDVVFYVSLLIEGCQLAPHIFKLLPRKNIRNIAIACIRLNEGFKFMKAIFCSDFFEPETLYYVFDEETLLEAVSNDGESANFCLQQFKKYNSPSVCDIRFNTYNELSFLQTCACENPDMIASLLEEDCYVAFENGHESAYCLLHLLAEHSYFLDEDDIKPTLAAIEFLCLRKKIILHEKDEENQPPLFRSNIHVEVLKKLIALGSPLTNDAKTNTVLHTTAKYLTPEEYEEIILCISPANLKEILKIETCDKSTALHSLVERLNPTQNSLKLFSTNQADFNALDEFGNSVLRLAIQSNASKETIKHLIDFKANCYEVNGEGTTLLHTAVTFGNMDAIEILLDRDLDIDAKDSVGNTPLHAAYLQTTNPIEVIEYLDEQDADDELVNDMGLNPMENALQLENIYTLSYEVIREILQTGMTPSADQKQAILAYFEVFLGSKESAKYNYSKYSEGKNARVFHDEDDIIILNTAILDGSPRGIIKELCDKYNLSSEIPLTKNYINDMSVLHTAVSKGDFELVHYFLANHFSEEMESPQMSNLLLCCVANSLHDEYSVINSKIQILNYFWTKYPKLFQVENDCPLILVQKVHPDILKLFISFGMDINVVNIHEQNLLHVAPLYLDATQYHDLIMYILNNKLDYKSNSNHKITLACIPGSNEFTMESVDGSISVDLFITAGFFGNETRDDYMKALLPKTEPWWRRHRSVSSQEATIEIEVSESGLKLKPRYNDTAKDVVTLLERLTSTPELITFFQCTDEDNFTTLHFAAGKSNLELETLALFLMFGVQINARGRMELTPLSWALEKANHLDTFRRLATIGANPFEKFEFESLLHLSALSGNISGIQFCIEAGLNVNDAGKMGFTPLHAVCSRLNKNMLTIVKLLISNGANINERSDSGDTPLHLAIRQTRKCEAEHRGLAAAKYMIKNGADASIANLNGHRVLDIIPFHSTPNQYHKFIVHVLKHGHYSLLSLIGNFSSTPLHVAVTYLEVTEPTLELYSIRKFNFDSLNAFGESIVYCAAAFGRSVKLLKSLGKYCTNIATVTHENNNIFHACVFGGNVEAVLYFVSLALTNISAPNNNGNTPLHYACMSQHENRSTMVETLVVHGANVNHENEMKESPLSLAFLRREYCHVLDEYYSDIDLKVIRILLENGTDTTRTFRNEASLLFHMVTHLKPADFHNLVLCNRWKRKAIVSPRQL